VTQYHFQATQYHFQAVGKSVGKNLTGLKGISMGFTYHSIFQFLIHLGFGVKIPSLARQKSLTKLKTRGCFIYLFACNRYKSQEFSIFNSSIFN